MVAIRPLQHEDIDRVVAIDIQTDAFPWRQKHYIEGMDAGYSSWVISEAGQPVQGFAVMMMVLDEAHLLKISVSTDYQRRGLGTALLQHLFARAKLAGATQMFLEVRRSNVLARPLYERQAFVEIGQRKAYYPTTEGREDAIVMRRELS
ncbi:ribosomal protein S18-alanine N-acetyltransferase [Viridibacterium curvum]|uniref:[Ribosomal protein bS18]-alanine N-acetyltransferase n=1 Tax=Viridibacterium curvum TaxID=1101404 RepID=A0ABP9QG90_9RHOO